MNEADTPLPTAPGIRGAGFAAALVLALAAGALSAYLTYASVSADGPAGCGTGSGCAQVLGSRWSKVLGLPVGVLALAAYAAAIGSVLMTRARGVAVSRLGWLGCALGAGSIVAAAAWFIYVQAVKLDAWCPYCLAGHTIGVALAAVLLAGFMRRRAFHAWPGLPLGVAAVAVMGIAQVRTPPDVYRVPAPQAGDYDITDDYSRRVGLIGGRLKMDLAYEPVLGPRDADAVIALLFDYGCPHCQSAHRALDAVRAEPDTSVAVVLMPMPLNKQCNPMVTYEQDRFADSCERSRLLYAVQDTDPAAVAAFDAWMFDVEPGAYRSAAEARAKAEELIGADALAKALADPQIDLRINRNVQAYMISGTDRVPVALAPGTDTLWGDSLGEPGVLRGFIAEAAQNKPASGDAPAANP